MFSLESCALCYISIDRNNSCLRLSFSRWDSRDIFRSQSCESSVSTTAMFDNLTCRSLLHLFMLRMTLWITPWCSCCAGLKFWCHACNCDFHSFQLLVIVIIIFVDSDRVILTMESTSVFQRLKTMKMLNNMGTKSFSIMVTLQHLWIVRMCRGFLLETCQEYHRRVEHQSKMHNHQLHLTA